MLDNPHVTNAVAQPAAVIRLTVPRDQITEVMGPAIGEVMAAAAAQGVTPQGSVFSHHLRMSAEEFDFEVGVPVSAPVREAGRVRPGELPGGWVARAVYRGPYEGLFAAWDEFDDWVAAEGHAPGPDLWECYTVGPDTTPDPADWRTELNRPLLRQT